MMIALSAQRRGKGVFPTESNIMLRPVLGLLAVLLLATPSLAQSTLGTFDGSANSDSASDAHAANTTMVGGNNFDFSSNSDGSLRVPPPGLANIAAGPCSGGGVTGSLSVTGVALGVGKQKIDESCDRRAWVQTLLGAAQQMNDKDGQVLRAVAVKVMEGDPIVGEAFDAVLGRTPDDKKAKGAAQERAADAGTPKKVGLSISSQNADTAENTCLIAASAASPVAYLNAIKARGCQIRMVQ